MPPQSPSATVYLIEAFLDCVVWGVSADLAVFFFLCISQPKLEVDAEFGKFEFFIGQSFLHSVNGVVHTWKHLHDSKSERVIMDYYMICNNTQQTLHFGQVRF